MKITDFSENPPALRPENVDTGTAYFDAEKDKKKSWVGGSEWVVCRATC